MSELRDLVKLIALVTAIGFLGLGLFHVINSIQYQGDLTVSYTANITFSKVLLLQESYVYHVSTYKYRMLYRFWRAPLTFNRTDFPCIVLKNIGGDKGGVLFAKDYRGRIYVSNPIAFMIVRRLAKRNWLGIVCYRYLKYRWFFNTGNHRLNAFYEVYPPIQTDGRYDHVNLKLADRHVPYTSVKIYIHDPDHSILKIYPHMKEFKFRRIKNGWLIEGRSPVDGLVEVEFVLKHGAVEGFYHHVSDVLHLTESANSMYYFERSLVKPLEMACIALILGFPAIVLLVYSRYGREKQFVVPEFLNYVPNPERKPWEVNVVFAGDAMSGNANAFFSTLLDLYRRGAVDLEPYEDKGFVLKRREMRIKILDRSKFDEEDVYESKVLKFLEKYSENGVFDTKPGNLGIRISVKSDLRKLLVLRNPSISRQFVETKGKKIFYVLNAISFVLAISVILIYGRELELRPVILAVTLVLQSGYCAQTHSQLFGKWKNDFYREKLEWDSFKKFLSDMAMIKKYAPEDVKVWKDWLVYGTALGAGDKVVNAMKSLNIEIPEVRIYSCYHDFVSTYCTSTKSSGGFGAGGGFGGGGAGGV